jgi:hypothetical protein
MEVVSGMMDDEEGKDIALVGIGQRTQPGASFLVDVDSHGNTNDDDDDGDDGDDDSDKLDEEDSTSGKKDDE